MQFKTPLLLALCIAFFAPAAQADDEISLFDATGKPVAYIDLDDEMNIFLWDGTPVAYLERDRDNGGYDVYGFNGDHLGWFVNGVVWDHRGYGSCAIEDAIRGRTQFEPFKSLQKLTPLKSLTSLAPLRPILKGAFGDTPCRFLLAEGKS